LRMISAWSVDHGIVLGQAIVADDSNEITYHIDTLGYALSRHP
jgi:hypothetical protein